VTPREADDGSEVGTTPQGPERDLGVQEEMPENTVVPAGAEDSALEVVAVREGMFGVHGSGDTSGYGGLRRPVVMPGATERPYGGGFDEVADRLEVVLRQTGVGDVVEKIVVHRGEMTIFVRREHLVTTVQHLRDDAELRYEFCSGVSGVHYPDDTGRELHVVYHLLSMTHNRRVRLEVVAPDADPHVPSIVAVYPTADWHERETYDFYGIVFDGHPALTRIMMPDDWPGHPQRKDYPLGGVPVEYKGATIPPPDTRRSYT
jgi:NADH-quinone oxidoreductase subunit C